MAEKRLYDEILEMFHPRSTEEFDRIFGQKGRAQKYVDHYEKTQGTTVLNDMDYLIGQAIVESTYGEDLTKENGIPACKRVKLKQEEYEKTSAIGRFFSYFNPFPNKYRDMRNEIREARDFLVEKGVDRKGLDRYVYGDAELKDVTIKPAKANEELIDELCGMEGKAKADVISGINSDENIVKYIKTQEFRKFISYETVDFAKDREFLKKASKVLDDSNYDADFAEEIDSLRMRHDKAEKDLLALFDEQSHTGYPVDLGEDKSASRETPEDNFKSLDKSVEKDAEVGIE
ncbi:MAG: hypothetical protein MJ082_00830 [Clostridia bacterium]|nr:hypothetical protein [Clostridia bacterium]